MKPRPAVYNKGCLGQNILIHLVKRIPKLGHPHPIQIKHQGIEIPGILATPLPAKVGNRRHNSKIRIPKLFQLGQLVGNSIAFGLTVTLNFQSNPGYTVTARPSLAFWDCHSNSVTLRILKMAPPLKTANRKDLPVKLIGRDPLQKLLQILILFPVQILQPLHGGLLIHGHTLTSKRKSSKKKIRCGGERLRAGRGERGSQRAPPTAA